MREQILNIIKSPPFIYAMFGVVLFIMGFLSNKIFGPDYIFEEVSEFILKHHYHTDIEFSP